MSMPLANPMEAMICYQKWYDEGLFIPLELRSEMSPKFKGFICDRVFWVVQSQLKIDVSVSICILCVYVCVYVHVIHICIHLCTKYM